MTAEILKQELKSHFQAGYPAIFIQSGEEARVDALLQEVCADLQWHALEWNLGYGWVMFANKQPLAPASDRTDLASCLPRLLDDDLSNKIIVIKDARLALENQDLAVARLKQLLNRIERHHRGQTTVVLVSESQFIPPPLEAQISLLHLPLPSQQEIADILRAEYQGVADELVPRLAATCSGLTLAEIHLVLSRVGQNLDALDESALDTIHKEKAQIISKSGVLEMIKVTEGPDDIGGLENLKEWLHRRASIFERLTEAKAAGVQPPKGVLIAGMPGCGKSLTAKAAAGLFKLPLLRLDIGSLLGKYVGESEHNMRRALRLAESVSPCVLWIDELEKAFVGMGGGGGSEVSSRLFGYFLTWMQEKSGAVFVIATANDISALPPELLRKGRFDEVFYVGFPNKEERQAILSIHAKQHWNNLATDEKTALIAGCRDFAGSDIQNAVNEAREEAFLAGGTLSYIQLSTAIRATTPLRETLKEKVSDYEKKFEELKLRPASVVSGLSIAQMIKQSSDPNPLKRKEVAENSDCTSELLTLLSRDKDTMVRHAVYQNPSCPTDVLSAMLTLKPEDNGYDKEALAYSCMHQNTPMDLLVLQLSRLRDNAGFIDNESDIKIASSKHFCKRVVLELIRVTNTSEVIDAIYGNWKHDNDILNKILISGKGSDSLRIRICRDGELNSSALSYLLDIGNSALLSAACSSRKTPIEFINNALVRGDELNCLALLNICERNNINTETESALTKLFNLNPEQYKVAEESTIYCNSFRNEGVLENTELYSGDEILDSSHIPFTLMLNQNISETTVSKLIDTGNPAILSYLLENPSLQKQTRQSIIDLMRKKGVTPYKKICTRYR